MYPGQIDLRRAATLRMAVARFLVTLLAVTLWAQTGDQQSSPLGASAFGEPLRSVLKKSTRYSDGADAPADAPAGSDEAGDSDTTEPVDEASYAATDAPPEPTATAAPQEHSDREATIPRLTLSTDKQPSAGGNGASPVRDLSNQPDLTIREPQPPDTLSAPATEVAETAETPRVELAPAALRGIVPGQTTAAELETAWGPPAQVRKEENDAGGEIRTYLDDIFAQIDVRVAGERVHSIEARLPSPVPPEQLAAQLNLAQVRAVEVPDAQGNLLGRSFPELGVLFSFDPRGQGLQVAQVIYEPIGVQSFVLRVESNLHGPYAQNLADLQFVIQQDDNYAYAHWLLAEIYFAVGKFDDATQAAHRAHQLDPETAAFEITLARCLAAQGKYQAALNHTTAVVQRDDLPPIVRARALVLQGDLVAAGPNRDMHQALKLHAQAIRLADPLAVSNEVAVRRTAKEILLDAHLATARDIAWGNWQQKSQTVPKWIERASAFAEDAINSEHASLEWRLRVAEQALAAQSSLNPPVDPSGWITEARLAADALLAGSNDALMQQRVNWELGMAYYYALVAARIGGNDNAALDYGELAVKHLDLGARQRQSTPEDDHLVGRLFFQIGAVYAVGREDHRDAVTYYDRAARRLEQPIEGSLLADPRLHGDALVSMGVSYWQTDQRDRAIELTEKGAAILRRAADAGLVQEKDLKVAYSNLSTMHAELGDQPRALRYAERAQGAETVHR